MLQEQYEIVQSIKCVREYCKEHGVFAYNRYDEYLDEVLTVYWEQHFQSIENQKQQETICQHYHTKKK